MEYQQPIERLAIEFEEKPFEFVTEVDMQARFVHLAREKLEEEEARTSKVLHPIFEGSTRSYKQFYKGKIEDKLADSGEIDRVHTEVSVKQDLRFDAVIFSKPMEGPIQWVASGSKRFDENDLDAVYELKFVKNRPYVPTHCHINDEEILEMSIEEVKEELNTDENKLEDDLRELRDLPDDVETYFVLFSNNNYLYSGNLSDTEEAEETKVRVGKAAREWLKESAGDTSILYGHPLSYEWLI